MKRWSKHSVAASVPGSARISVVLICALLLVASSGVYNVAASSGHFSWVQHLLEWGMHRSVITWSLSVDAPPTDLDSHERIAVGAAHFYGGCANCHGSPTSAVNPVHDQMLPPPPKLAGEVYDWTEKQLFWIVRHGIKYTGMPFWNGYAREDEVWSVVAFLRNLPELDAQAYTSLVRGNTIAVDLGAPKLVAAGNFPTHLTACDRCHDTAAAPPISPLVPRLGGQSQVYLLRSLREYRDNQRQSGIMEPVAVELTERQMNSLARYYATLKSPGYVGLPERDSEQVERGKELVLSGAIDRGIPPCQACHGASKLSAYPRLAGQAAMYIAQQLALWQRDVRVETPIGSLMATIAKRLSQQQIDDVAAYYQSQSLLLDLEESTP